VHAFPSVANYVCLTINDDVPGTCVAALRRPLCDGGTLEERLADLTPPQRHTVAFGVARGVDFLHRRGIVHGRIDASNVLIKDGMKPLIVGFPLCETERRARGDAARTEDDIRALGRILWALAIGRVPEQADVVPPSPYENITNRCLHFEPADLISAGVVAEVLKHRSFRTVVGEENIAEFKEYVESFQEELDRDGWRT
jgi:serine/threonine protein kinase